MGANQLQCRRVLIANERDDRLDMLAGVVAGLGHEAVVRKIRTGDVEAVIAQAQPDVVLVGLGPSLENGLALISELVGSARCPVIVLLAASDPTALREAAKRGVFACVVHDDAAELEGAIDIALRRFADYHGLKDAFARRAVIEQAKGILMARHGIAAEPAFAMLRMHSQNTGRKLADVAAAVVKSHQLLGAPTPAEPSQSEQ
jgi:AmiR/NasT family two-component response regulator